MLYKAALDRIEWIVDQHIGSGEPIEVVRLPGSLEVEPHRTDLIPIGIFASDQALDILIGSVAHESLKLHGQGMDDPAIAEMELLVQAALAGQVTETMWHRSGRLLHGIAVVSTLDGQRTYETGVSLLKHIGKVEERMYSAYPTNHSGSSQLGV